MCRTAKPPARGSNLTCHPYPAPAGILLPSTLLSPVQTGAYTPMGASMLPPGMLPPGGGPQRPTCSYTYRLSNTQVRLWEHAVPRGRVWRVGCTAQQQMPGLG